MGKQSGTRGRNMQYARALQATLFTHRMGAISGTRCSRECAMAEYRCSAATPSSPHRLKPSSFSPSFSTGVPASTCCPSCAMTCMAQQGKDACSGRGDA